MPPRYRLCFVWLILWGLLTACGGSEPADPQDLAKPSITLTTSVPGLTSGTLCGTLTKTMMVVQSGQPVELHLRFQDDKALAQYKIDIHNNFDCHTHGRLAATQATPWQQLEVKDITGKEALVTYSVQVPTDPLAGNYHMLIQCLDAVGNEAPFLELDLVISNTADMTPPVLTLRSPTQDSLRVARGSTLSLEGQLTDNLPLGGGQLVVFYKNSVGDPFTVAQQFLAANAATSVPFSIPLTVPTYTPTGLYTLYIQGFDGKNNPVEKRLQMTIY